MASLKALGAWHGQPGVPVTRRSRPSCRTATVRLSPAERATLAGSLRQAAPQRPTHAPGHRPGPAGVPSRTVLALRLRQLPVLGGRLPQPDGAVRPRPESPTSLHLSLPAASVGNADSCGRSSVDGGGMWGTVERSGGGWRREVRACVPRHSPAAARREGPAVPARQVPGRARWGRGDHQGAGALPVRLPAGRVRAASPRSSAPRR